MIDLLAMLKSGELHRRAQAARTLKEMCDGIGLSLDTFEKRRQRHRRNGIAFPGWLELRGGACPDTNPDTYPDTLSGYVDVDVPVDDLVGEFGDEPTNPSGPPLPAMQPGFNVKRVSTYVGPDGDTKGQWIITEQNQKQRMEALLAALPSICEPFAGMADPVTAPDDNDDDLLAVYVMGDPHLGSHVWGAQTGADDYDLKIGERELVQGIRDLVAVAPPARKAIVLSLGDFYHFDNLQQTTTKGTRQDGDSRWQKVFETGVRASRCVTDIALGKHEEVEDIFVPGNHDMQSSTAMAICVNQFYEREPRVTVNTNPNPFRLVRFGDVMIMICHGDESKAEKLWGVMAHDYAPDWGQTHFRYVLAGHLHHRVAQEFPGCEIERFPTLAARDRWHHGAGYRAQQTMCVDTYHRTRGRINRSIVGIRQVRASLAAAP